VNFKAFDRRLRQIWRMARSSAQIGSRPLGNSGATCPNALGKRALRIKFKLQFATGDKLLEQFVFADVGRNHFLDLALFEQNANAEAVDAGVV